MSRDILVAHAAILTTTHQYTKPARDIFELQLYRALIVREVQIEDKRYVFSILFWSGMNFNASMHYIHVPLQEIISGCEHYMYQQLIAL